MSEIWFWSHFLCYSSGTKMFNKPTSDFVVKQIIPQKVLLNWPRQHLRNCPRNTDWRGSISTLDLLAPTCLVHLLCINKAFVTFWAKQVRRLTVLSLPIQLEFHALSYKGSRNFVQGSMHDNGHTDRAQIGPPSNPLC